MGTPANVQSGPGTLRHAPLGTAEPTDLTVAWPSGWVSLGYTTQGHKLGQNLTATDLEVEEEFDPVAVKMTKRQVNIDLGLAEITAKNLARVLNSATATHVSAVVGPPAVAEHYLVEPPDVGAEVRCMLGWESEDGLERWIYREAIQVGNITADRRKASLTAFTATFRLIKPATGSKLYAALFAPARAGA